MLYEIAKVKQVPREGYRRWFTDADHDLVVWYPARGDSRIVGFQFSYEKQDNENAVTWTRERGFEHHRIDAGEVPYGGKMTPMLLADGPPDVKSIAERFRSVSAELDPEVARFVRHVLESYAH
ncbi:MAG: hypothetical protein ACLFM6_04955 [Spirochaetaceae bacterium]